MLLLVALERGAWAVVKIIFSAIVALVLLLWILYARKRRRDRPFHSSGTERCFRLRSTTRGFENVRLVEVKTEHATKTEDEHCRNTEESRSSANLCSLIQVATAKPVTAEDVVPIKDLVQAKDFVMAQYPLPTEDLLEAGDLVKTEDPVTLKENVEAKHSLNSDNAVNAERHVKTEHPLKSPADNAAQDVKGHTAHQELKSEQSLPGLQPSLAPVADVVVDMSPQASIENAVDPFSQQVSNGTADPFLRQASWNEELRPKPIHAIRFASHGHAVREKAGSSKAVRVRFENRVHCRAVNHFSKISPERKAAYWWQPDDFAEFLKVRIEIGKAYRLAARKLGVDIMKLSSVGTHSKEGYKFMIQQMPELANESRRGLGLGRKRQRAKNRDEYIAAVLKEQRRQRDMAAAEGKLEVVDGVANFELDSTALGLVAQRVSEKDRKYSHNLAMSYLKQAKEEAKAEADKGKAEAEDAGDKYLRLGVIEDEIEDIDHLDGEELDREGSFCEDLRDETIAPMSPDVPKGAASQMSSKGFGLSRDHLAQKGLAATGHYISRNQKKGIDVSIGSFSDDSDGDFTTDADDTDADGSMSGADASGSDESPRISPVRRRGRLHMR